MIDFLKKFFENLKKFLFAIWDSLFNLNEKEKENIKNNLTDNKEINNKINKIDEKEINN